MLKNVELAAVAGGVSIVTPPGASTGLTETLDWDWDCWDWDADWLPDATDPVAPEDVWSVVWRDVDVVPEFVVVGEVVELVVPAPSQKTVSSLVRSYPERVLLRRTKEMQRPKGRISEDMLVESFSEPHDDAVFTRQKSLPLQRLHDSSPREVVRIFGGAQVL